MTNAKGFCICGLWVALSHSTTLDVINPAVEPGKHAGRGTTEFSEIERNFG